MKTILATTYAVNPNKGSEDGMGWNYVCQIARYHKVIAVTRCNNRKDIEHYMATHKASIYKNITFLYFDLPYYLRFWKKGGRGALLYFYLWQWSVVSFIRRQRLQFDIVHNLNFHNDWTPSFLWKLGKPFVWGPIGHHPLIPSIFNKNQNFNQIVKDKITWMVKKYFWKVDPSLRKCLQKANYIWCMHDEVEKEINLSCKQYHVSPSVASHDYGWLPEVDNEVCHVLSAGRLVHMKGFDLTIKAFARFITDNPTFKAHLTIVGSGPDFEKLHSLVQKLCIIQHVTLVHWMERASLLEMMKSASIFLFPSHEGAGMVVPEALSMGLPVVALDNCGPGKFIEQSYGEVVSAKTLDETIEGLAMALSNILLDQQKYQAMRYEARKAFEQKFHWDRRGEKLNEIYQKII